VLNIVISTSVDSIVLNVTNDTRSRYDITAAAASQELLITQHTGLYLNTVATAEDNNQIEKVSE
jgi:hypothetical protein